MRFVPIGMTFMYWQLRRGGLGGAMAPGGAALSHISLQSRGAAAAHSRRSGGRRGEGSVSARALGPGAPGRTARGRPW